MKTLFLFLSFVATFATSFSQISVTDTLYFNSNSTSPINNINSSNANCVIGIEGYASVDGSSNSNQILSENRANSVYNTIVNTSTNLSPEINIVGLGETSEFGNNLSDNRIVLVISSVACLQSYDKTNSYDWTEQSVTINENIVENTDDNESNSIIDTNSQTQLNSIDSIIFQSGTNTLSENNNATVVKLDTNETLYSNGNVNPVDSLNSNIVINDSTKSILTRDSVFNAGKIQDLFVKIDSVNSILPLSQSPCLECIDMASQWESKFVYDLTQWRLDKTNHKLRVELAKSYKAWEHYNSRARYCMSKKAYKQYHKSIMEKRDNQTPIDNKTPTIDLESRKDFNQFKYTTTSAKKVSKGKSYSQIKRKVRRNGTKGMSRFDWFLVNTGLSCR